MTLSLELRAISSGDLPFLFSLYASTRRDELAPVPWSDEQKLAFLTMQFEAQHEAYTTNYPGATLDLVVVDHTPVGRLYVYRTSNEIRIIDIAIVEGQRRRGIGSMLLRQLLDEAARSERSLTIHVEKNNPALALYERLGFRAVEDKEVYWFMECKPDAQLKTAS